MREYDPMKDYQPIRGYHAGPVKWLQPRFWGRVFLRLLAGLLAAYVAVYVIVLLLSVLTTAFTQQSECGGVDPEQRKPKGD